MTMTTAPTTTTMTTTTVAGLTIARRGDDLVDCPLAALLHLAPAAPGESVVDVVVTVEAIEHARPDPGGEPVLFHGPARVRRLGNTLVVWDGCSEATIDDAAAHGITDAGAHPPCTMRWFVPREPALRAPHTVELFALLSLLLAVRARRRFHLHAGLLVDGAGDGVLVVGTSGAGKSTTCIALAEHGLQLRGDDVALVDDAVRVHALPKPLHVGAATARAFPRLGPFLGATLASGKRDLLASDAWPASPSSSSSSSSPSSSAGVRVTRLVLPSIAPAAAAVTTTTALRVPPAEVFGALLEAGALVVADGLPWREQQLQGLEQLATVDAVAVVIGQDALTDGRVIAAALHRAWS